MKQVEGIMLTHTKMQKSLPGDLFERFILYSVSAIVVNLMSICTWVVEI